MALYDDQAAESRALSEAPDAVVATLTRLPRHPVTTADRLTGRDTSWLAATLALYALSAGWCWLLHLPEASARGGGVWAFVLLDDRVDETGRIDPAAKLLIRYGAWQFFAAVWALFAAQASLWLARRRLRPFTRARVVWAACALIATIAMAAHAAAEIVYLRTDLAVTMLNAATFIVVATPIELACLALLAWRLWAHARRHQAISSRLPAALARHCQQ